MDNAFLESMSESLGEELAIAGNRKVAAVTCTIENVLVEADLREYCATAGSLPATKSDEKDIHTIRARHHSVARLLAAGIPEGVVAELTQFTRSYLSTLKNNPSMIELIAHYRAPGDQATAAIAEKMRTVGHAALERILEEIPEMDHNALIQTAKLGADRSGNGPTQKHDVSHTHILDNEQVARLAESARNRNKDRIIDVSAVRKSLPAPRRDGEDA